MRLPPSSVLRAAPKEALGRIEGDGVDAPGEGAPARGHGDVVGAREAGDGVEQDDDVPAVLDEALGPFEAELGDAAVVLDRLVEGGAVDLAVDGALDVGDLLGALPDERDEDVDVGVVGADAGGDLLEEGGLAGLGGRDDEAALAPADGCEDVDHAGGELGRGGLELHLDVGEDGGQVLEVPAPTRDLRVEPVDRLHAREAVVALGLLGGPHLAEDEVAGAQAEASDLGLRDVGVGLAGLASVVPEEAVAVGQEFEDTAGELMSLLLGVAPEELVHDGVLGLGRGAAAVDAHLVDERDHLIGCLGLEFCDVHGISVRARAPARRNGLCVIRLSERVRGRGPCGKRPPWRGMRGDRSVVRWGWNR